MKGNQGRNGRNALGFVLGTCAAVTVVAIAFVIALIFVGWEGLINP